MKSLYEIQMAAILKEAGIPFETQKRFSPARKWTFDFCILPAPMKIAVEVEGAIWTRGRHSYGKGFIGDCEKYNAAQILGWRVLRYTPETLTQVTQDLEKLL